MSRYGWIITRDLLETEDSRYNRVGTTGPHDLTNEQEPDLQDGAGDRFKMYDSDDELYYEGRIVGDYDGFEPLDDFGRPDAGAVTIKYQDIPELAGGTGEWKEL